MNSINSIIFFTFAALTVIPETLSVPASGKVSFYNSIRLSKVGKSVIFQLWTLDPSTFLIFIIFNAYLGDVDPIKTIFETCDVESDKKLSMEEIMENANCLKVLQMAGMQIAGLKDGFSMIDKDEDGYVSMEEAKTLNRNVCGHSC